MIKATKIDGFKKLITINCFLKLSIRDSPTFVKYKRTNLLLFTLIFSKCLSFESYGQQRFLMHTTRSRKVF